MQPASATQCAGAASQQREHDPAGEVERADEHVTPRELHRRQDEPEGSQDGEERDADAKGHGTDRTGGADRFGA